MGRLIILLVGQLLCYFAIAPLRAADGGLEEEDGRLRPLATASEAGAPTTWEEYAGRVADALGELLQGRITSSACYDMIPAKPDFVFQDVHDFIRGMVWEIGGFRSELEGLHQLLAEGATQDRIVAFIDWLG